MTPSPYASFTNGDYDSRFNMPAVIIYDSENNMRYSFHQILPPQCIQVFTRWNLFLICDRENNLK